MADCYDSYLDQLVYAEECGFDGDLRQRAPQQRLRADAVAQPDRRRARHAARREAAIRVLGNSVALYNPPVRVAEEMAMLDLLSRRAAGRRLPGRHADGHVLTPTAQTRASCARKYHEGIDLILQGVDERPSRSPSTASSPSSATSTLCRARCQQPHPPIWIPGGGSIETWDWCAERDYVYGVPLLLRLQARPRRRSAATGTEVEAPRQGPQPVPAGLPPVRRRRRHRRRGLPALQGARRVLLQPLAARLPGLRRPAGLRHRGVGARALQAPGARASSAPSRPGTTSRGTRWSSKGYVVIGSPDTVREQLEEVAKDAQHRAPDARCSSSAT